MVNRPVMTHDPSSHPTLPTCRAMSAETMKMPVPIMEPATIMVESNSPRLCCKPVLEAPAGEMAETGSAHISPREWFMVPVVHPNQDVCTPLTTLSEQCNLTENAPVKRSRPRSWHEPDNHPARFRKRSDRWRRRGYPSAPMGRGAGIRA